MPAEGADVIPNWVRQYETDDQTLLVRLLNGERPSSTYDRVVRLLFEAIEERDALEAIVNGELEERSSQADDGEVEPSEEEDGEGEAEDAGPGGQAGSAEEASEGAAEDGEEVGGPDVRSRFPDSQTDTDTEESGAVEEEEQSGPVSSFLDENDEVDDDPEEE